MKYFFTTLATLDKIECGNTRFGAGFKDCRDSQELLNQQKARITSEKIHTRLFP
jgi:hypothetical protein